MKVPVFGFSDLAHAPEATRGCCLPVKTYIWGLKETSGRLARTQRSADCTRVGSYL